jgi:seryl-tRNA synthetase
MSQGLDWNAEGFIALSGPLLELSEAVDRTFLELAATFGAARQEVGPLLAVRDLRKIDYFSSFPHLVTFQARADDDEENLRALARTNGAEATGPLQVPRFAPIDMVLAPAACYGVYIARQQTVLTEPQWITVRGTCFRAERSFQPLVRQPSFSMREIVHLGTPESVELFLREGRERALRLAAQWDLELTLETATDPFFDPARSPKYLHAKLFPTKQELIHGGLALGSLNNHRNFFGEAFEITIDGQPVHTACIAFGIERWLHAILERGPQ